MEYTKSYELYQRAQKTLGGGLNSNSRNRKPHPIYFQKTQGAYATDVDGNTFIDLIMGNGTMILGHNNAEFNERMATYMRDNGGMMTGFDSALSVSVAEKFTTLTKQERVRFTNTGTEAAMHCMHIARAYTGRSKIAVVEGAYDGWCDSMFVNSFAPLSAIGEEDAPLPVAGTGGMDATVVASTVVIPFNNIAATERIVRAHKDELAAIIIEPVMIDIGFIEPDKAYLQCLRNLCDELSIVLIFDELLTGFRVTLGGAQDLYGVQADLTMYGKAYANGYITAAVAGKAAVMDTCAPGGKTAFIGTFNGHQVSMCAAAATLDMLADGQVTKTLLANTNALAQSFNSLAQKTGVAAHLLGGGGHFQVYFTSDAPTNYRTAAVSNAAQYGAYVNALQENGVWCSQNPLSHHVLSLAHDQKVIEEVLAAMEKGLLAAAKA